jgi:hypothetical protein
MDTLECPSCLCLVLVGCFTNFKILLGHYLCVFLCVTLVKVVIWYYD